MAVFILERPSFLEALLGKVQEHMCDWERDIPMSCDVLPDPILGLVEELLLYGHAFQERTDNEYELQIAIWDEIEQVRFALRHRGILIDDAREISIYPVEMLLIIRIPSPESPHELSNRTDVQLRRLPRRPSRKQL